MTDTLVFTLGLLFTLVTFAAVALIGRSEAEEVGTEPVRTAPLEPQGDRS